MCVRVVSVELGQLHQAHHDGGSLAGEFASCEQPRSMTSQLVADALMMAVWRRGRPVQLLHHSDQGSQPRFNWSSQHCFVGPTVAAH